MSTQATRKGKTLLAGHTLEYEGRAYHQPSCALCVAARRAVNWHSKVGEGHGLCSCGAQSEHLSSGAARKRWHAAHKDEIRAAAAVWLCRIGWHRWVFVPEIGDRCLRCWDRP